MELRNNRIQMLRFISTKVNVELSVKKKIKGLEQGDVRCGIAYSACAVIA